MFRSIKQWCIGALSMLFIVGAFDSFAQVDGGALFKAKCATCHQPHKDGTGPKLFHVREKWATGGAKDGSIYQWVANWNVAAAADPYAKQVSETKSTAMNTFPDLAGKTKEIDAIFDWIDSQPDPAVAKADAPSAVGSAAAVGEVEEGGLSWVWILMGVVFVVIIMAVGGVRRQLENAAREHDGQSVNDDLSFGQEFRAWAWKYKRYVGLGGLVIVIALIVSLFLSLYSIGVLENYQPSQPIEFPHDIHAGKNGIDCKYCHNSAIDGRTAGIPTVNVCMNCHKQINGNDATQQEKIAKIYAAAGWDPVKQAYTGKTKEIIWNKVHVLPDHVYFNHQQHVVAGGVDCKQCHGDMTKMNATAKVQPVTELNKIEGNVQLTKATLTMGWCIECHAEKEISAGSLDSKGSNYYNEIHNRLLKDRKLYNKFLQDKKITVKELGGWECAKCHY
ncbi:cytochrome c3 family protein [Fluviicola sp.]|jgi:mono/diheme cytochrome c family protein|uniref:cytochrome c3 family protein n=1 Tax=Fluviicola sp. TaxID=1917219 RepID=UPI00281D7ABB|nr:cytochrome c3 family protein [Fluviicola sp.]MDR0803393.1 c-type cytochrome [Fluviicola sp.]